MTKMQDFTIGSIEVEGLAFRGFENPEDLDLQAVRKVCAALLMASLSQNRSARSVMREHERETTTSTTIEIDRMSIEQQALKTSKDEYGSKADMLLQTVTLANAALDHPAISEKEAAKICEEVFSKGHDPRDIDKNRS